VAGGLAIPALKDIGRNYLLNLAGVLLWPLGWAVAALVTQGMLDYLSNPALDYMDLASAQPNMQKTIGTATVGFWIIFSTIAAPVIIQRVLATGALATTGLFSGGSDRWPDIDFRRAGRNCRCTLGTSGRGCRHRHGGNADDVVVFGGRR
jgi:hypothetical protein